MIFGVLHRAPPIVPIDADVATVATKFLATTPIFSTSSHMMNNQKVRVAPMGFAGGFGRMSGVSDS